MATVLIMDNAKHTGHAAMELDDGTYVSFHPKTQSTIDPVVKSVPGEFSFRRADDVERPDECTPPRYKITSTFRLTGLHEDAMARAFEHMQKHTQYQFLAMNCATVVAKLLIVGAGDAILGGHLSVTAWKLRDHAQQFFNKRNERLDGRLTEHAIGIAETAVVSTVRTMEAEARAGGRPQRRSILPLVTIALLAADVVARDLVWTPGEVLRLAKYIERHLPKDGGLGDDGGRRSSW